MSSSGRSGGVSGFMEDLRSEMSTSSAFSVMTHRSVLFGDDTLDKTKRIVADLFKDDKIDIKWEQYTTPWQRFRIWVYLFFEDNSSRKGAAYFGYYMMTLVVMSTLTFCLQSILTLNHTPEQTLQWSYIEAFIVSQFTADYLIRIFSCPEVGPFVISPLNLIDLLAILPFWIQLIITTATNGSANVSSIAIVRLLRLARILRMFKLGKGSMQLKLVIGALKRSREGITMLGFMFALASIVFSSAMYFAETAYCTLVDGLWIYNANTESAGSPTPFQSIFDTMWWAVVTMTTVGYGDTFPITPPGKVVGVATILAGLLVVAFPVTIIGANLNEVWAEYKAELDRRKEKKAAERRLRKYREQQKKAKRDQARQQKELAEKAGLTTTVMSTTRALASTTLSLVVPSNTSAASTSGLSPMSSPASPKRFSLDRQDTVDTMFDESDETISRGLAKEITAALLEVEQATEIVREQVERIAIAKARLDKVKSKLVLFAVKRRQDNRAKIKGGLGGQGGRNRSGSVSSKTPSTRGGRGTPSPPPVVVAK